MVARTALLGAWLTSVSCSGADPTDPLDTPGTTRPGGTDDTETAADGLEVADLSGTWRGSIGEAYESGCLCLTLSADGDVIGPSGITLGFTVTSAGDHPDTTVLDADARLVRIHMIVSGSGFRIDDATVGPDADTMAGSWLGDVPSAFDGSITLDREPETCMDRTGLSGAPC
jgi:hypothetical protein